MTQTNVNEYFIHNFVNREIDLNNIIIKLNRPNTTIPKTALVLRSSKSWLLHRYSTNKCLNIPDEFIKLKRMRDASSKFHRKLDLDTILKYNINKKVKYIYENYGYLVMSHTRLQSKVSRRDMSLPLRTQYDSVIMRNIGLLERTLFWLISDTVYYREELLHEFVKEIKGTKNA